MTMYSRYTAANSDIGGLVTPAGWKHLLSFEVFTSNLWPDWCHNYLMSKLQYKYKPMVLRQQLRTTETSILTG